MIRSVPAKDSATSQTSSAPRIQRNSIMIIVDSIGPFMASPVDFPVQQIEIGLELVILDIWIGIGSLCQVRSVEGHGIVGVEVDIPGNFSGGNIMSLDSLSLVNVIVWSSALDMEIRHDGGSEEAPV